MSVKGSIKEELDTNQLLSEKENDNKNDIDNENHANSNIPENSINQQKKKRTQAEGKAQPVKKPKIQKYNVVEIKIVKENSTQFNVPADVLDRMVKISVLALNPGTEAEDDQARSILAKELSKYNIERAEFFVEAAKRSCTNSSNSLDQEISSFKVEIPIKRIFDWMCNLSSAIAMLFSVAYYDSNNGGFVFYGDSGSANSAAVLFSELFAAINMMMATFEPSKHRRSYALGLSSGYKNMVQDLIKIRNSEVTNNERKLADLRKELERAVARELIIESEAEAELIPTTELELMVNEASKTLSQSQALVLLSKHDKLKVERAETFLNLSSKPRKSKANFDAESYKKGKEDSKKLSLGNSIE